MHPSRTSTVSSALNPSGNSVKFPAVPSTRWKQSATLATLTTGIVDLIVVRETVVEEEEVDVVKLELEGNDIDDVVTLVKVDWVDVVVLIVVVVTLDELVVVVADTDVVVPVDDEVDDDDEPERVLVVCVETVSDVFDIVEDDVVKEL